MRRILIGILGTTLALWALRAFVAAPLLEGILSSQAVYGRDSRLLRLTLAADQQYRLAVGLDAVSPLLVEATLLHEDQYFYGHPGFNPLAFFRAVWRTYAVRDRRVGASTITMQVARLKYGIRSHTILGKLSQIARALEIELLHGKREILEAYLNLAPYGENIQGVGAASLVYFGKPASDLSLSEALTLAVIPQNPTRRRPSRDDDADLRKARGLLFNRWMERHPEDSKQRARLALPVDVRRRSELPFLAPHFVDEVLGDSGAAPIIHSSLDLPSQQLVERQTRQYIEQKASGGLTNAAALLVDTRSMETLALVGSSDFYGVAIGGQVNGTRARRSPGSALKPFIYALALQQGLLHPQTVLKDTPRSFGDFNPENFDREFVGPVSATDALVRSRNIPAVSVASQLKNPTFYEFLQKAGIKGLREESWYGLATVLGGVEVSMEELAGLYAMLANGGILRPITLARREGPPSGVPVLSAEASYLVLDMLTHNPRPGRGMESDWVEEKMPIPWKTGTSSGFRDAWAVGLVGPYVLAVWIGNFDGHGDPALIGREAAGPLFFRIADAIQIKERSLPTPWQEGKGKLHLAHVKVCAVSGQIPGAWCKTTTATSFIPGVSPIRVCEIHRAVEIDPVTGLRACGPVGPGARKWRTKIFEFWPSDVLKLFALAGIGRRIPPEYPKSCSPESIASYGSAPQITSPNPAVVYNLRAGRALQDPVPLTATTDADARQVHWFLDDQYLGESAPATPFFWNARPGKFVIRAVDDHGRADAEILEVAMVE